MAIVKINTLDRTLITNIEQPLEEFITHINVQGRFSFIDSKLNKIINFLSICFFLIELDNILVMEHMN
jgi:hypothetical protein